MSTTGLGPLPAAPVALREGDLFPPCEIGPLTRTDFVRYAGASGDFNPIHYDDVLVTRSGMPSVFGMGMLHGGALGIRLARWVGPDNIRSFAVRFTGQVWPGDVLTMRGHVTSVSRKSDELIAEIELTVVSHNRVVVMTARASAVVV